MMNAGICYTLNFCNGFSKSLGFHREMKMASNTKNKHYSKLTITIHWLMLLLIVAVYATINLRELYPKGSDPRETLKTLHFMLGLSVLLLIFIRLPSRLVGGTPAIIPELALWQKIAANGVHGFLYLFMIVMPLLGWLTLSAAGKPIPFFGVDLPALITKNKDLAKTLKYIHETIGTIGYYVIGIHAAAALFHHYIKRDNTLIRMLPGFKK
jgi:superoxide oxidase